MANIKTHLNNIKGALYGKDVRGSIHDGIDAINKEVENTTGRQVDLENTFDQLVINAGNSNAEIVDARVKNDGTSYSKLGDRLNAVDSQLAHIEKEQISTSSLGFSLTDGVKNFELLTNAISLNKKIIVDNFFPLHINHAYDVYNDLYIEGVSKKAGFDIEISSECAFDVKSNLNAIFISNLKMNFKNGAIFLRNNCNVNYFSVCDNIICGDVRFYRNNANANTINTINIKGNEFIDIGNYVFYCVDLDFDILSIVKNKIRNLGSCFVYHTQSGQYSKEVYKKGVIICEYNYVKNDLEYWSTVEDGYICLLLTKGVYQTIYQNNHVEGLHSLTNSPVYDAYLSSEIVFYKNNINKNNMNLSPDNKQYNTFIKAKTGLDNSKRYVENNTFITTKEFTDSLNVSEDNNTISICLNLSSKHIEIKNNTFDVYRLKADVNSSREEFYFEGNNVICTYSTGVFLYGNNLKKAHFLNNFIEHKNGGMILIAMNEVTDAEIVINGNTFKNCDSNLLQCKSDTLIFNNNTLINATKNISNLMPYSNIKKYIANNNILESCDKVSNLFPRSCSDAYVKHTLKLEKFNDTGIFINKFNDGATKGNHLINLEMINNGIKYTGEIKFSVVEEIDGLYLVYNSNKVEQKVRLFNLETSINFSGKVDIDGNISSVINFSFWHSPSAKAINLNFNGTVASKTHINYEHIIC